MCPQRCPSFCLSPGECNCPGGPESGYHARAMEEREIVSEPKKIERPTGVPNPVTTVTTPQACDFEPCSGIRPTGSEGSVLRSTTVEALERQRPAEAGRSHQIEAGNHPAHA